VALALGAALTLSISEARAQQADAAPRTPATAPALSASARPPLVGWRDAWFGIAASAAVVVAYQADARTRRAALESDGPGLDRLSKGAEKLGKPVVLVPVLLVVDQVAGLRRLPGLRGATRRIAGAILVAGISAEVLKKTVGRARPEDAGGDPYRFEPFSSFESFPSGHATLAFAAAAALDQETSAGWIPCVAYPLAGLVGWSRVHDDRHWSSDVIAGAALGAWVGHKVSKLESRSGLDPRRWFGVVPSPFVTPGGLGLQVSASF
jgi:membrane-associated phospholipid phosphatase